MIALKKAGKRLNANYRQSLFVHIRSAVCCKLRFDPMHGNGNIQLGNAADPAESRLSDCRYALRYNRVVPRPDEHVRLIFNEMPVLRAIRRIAGGNGKFFQCAAIIEYVITEIRHPLRNIKIFKSRTTRKSIVSYRCKIAAG